MKKIIVAILLIATMLNSSVLDEDSGYKIIAKTYKVHDVTPTILWYMYNGTITRWEDGSKITMIVASLNSELQNTMIIELLGVSPTIFRQAVTYNKLHVMGIGESMINKVVSLEGSAGLVEVDALMATGEGIVLLRIVEEGGDHE